MNKFCIRLFGFIWLLCSLTRPQRFGNLQGRALLRGAYHPHFQQVCWDLPGPLCLHYVDQSSLKTECNGHQWRFFGRTAVLKFTITQYSSIAGDPFSADDLQKILLPGRTPGEKPSEIPLLGPVLFGGNKKHTEKLIDDILDKEIPGLIKRYLNALEAGAFSAERRQKTPAGDNRPPAEKKP